MRTLAQHTASLAGRLAQDLLKAWITGDTVQVTTELENSISVPCEGCDSGEEERRQLLQAVAVRMRDCRDLPGFYEQSPDLEPCMRLLGQLVSPRPDQLVSKPYRSAACGSWEN